MTMLGCELIEYPGKRKLTRHYLTLTIWSPFDPHHCIESSEATVHQLHSALFEKASENN